MNFLNRDKMLKGEFPENDKTFHEILFYYASKGLTDDSLAMACGLPISEFREKRRNDPEFEQTIFRARLPMISAIDEQAWGLAMGSKKRIKKVVKTDSTGLREETITESDIAPDKEMLKLMMKNFANYSDETVLSISDEEKAKTEQLKSLLK